MYSFIFNCKNFLTHILPWTCNRISTGYLFVNEHFHNSYDVLDTSLYKSFKIFVKIQTLTLLIKIATVRGSKS